MKSTCLVCKREWDSPDCWYTLLFEDDKENPISWLNESFIWPCGHLLSNFWPTRTKTGDAYGVEIPMWRRIHMYLGGRK